MDWDSFMNDVRDAVEQLVVLVHVEAEPRLRTVCRYHFQFGEQRYVQIDALGLERFGLAE